MGKTELFATNLKCINTTVDMALRHLMCETEGRGWQRWGQEVTLQMSLMIQTSLHMRGSLGRKKKEVLAGCHTPSTSWGVAWPRHSFFTGASRTTFSPVKVFARDIWTFHHPRSLCFRGLSPAQCETTSDLGRRKLLFWGTFYVALI